MIGFLAVVVSAIFVFIFFMWMKNKYQDLEYSDTKPIIINHMKHQTDGHAFLKAHKIEFGEKRVKVISYPRDLSGKMQHLMHKGKKNIYEYTTYFDKKLFDPKPDFSVHLPVFEAYPQKISQLSESDRADPRIIERINNGNKAADIESLYENRQLALQRLGSKLATNELNVKYNEIMTSLFKDKIDVNTITKPDEKK